MRYTKKECKALLRFACEQMGYFEELHFDCKAVNKFFDELSERYRIAYEMYVLKAVPYRVAGEYLNVSSQRAGQLVAKVVTELVWRYKEGLFNSSVKINGDNDIIVLGLTSRAYNCLKFMGCDTINDAVKRVDEIDSVRSAGVGMKAEVRNKLEALGFLKSAI